MRRSLVFLTLALCGELAFPISRIGNNRVIRDPRDAYRTLLPSEFASVTSVGDGGLVLASGLFAASPPVPADIQMLPFRSQYPQLVGQDESKMEEFFTKSAGIRYEKLKVANDATTLFGEGDQTYVGVSFCADGRGYVIFAPKLEITGLGMKSLLTHTEFEKPCRK
jgi:hypothetical protein